MQLANLCAHLHAQLGIKVKSGSSIKNTPASRQSPAKRHSLTLPAGKRRYVSGTRGRSCAAQFTRSSITSLAIFCIFRPNAMLYDKPSYADTTRSLEHHRYIACFGWNVIHSFAVNQQSPPLISSSPAIMRGWSTCRQTRRADNTMNSLSAISG